jgi:hypothetical protein
MGFSAKVKNEADDTGRLLHAQDKRTSRVTAGKQLLRAFFAWLRRLA